jgi:hypothetical protein
MTESIEEKVIKPAKDKANEQKEKQLLFLIITFI